MNNPQQLLNDLAKAKVTFQLKAIQTAMGIETSQTSNATPNRNWDWQATRTGYEGGDPIGHGPTREAAIEDLLTEEEGIL